MFLWLKKRIKKWLEDEDSPISNHLEIIKDGKILKVTVTCVSGLYLMCHENNGTNALITSKQARDEKLFWKLWNHLSGNAKLTCEDGSAFDPEKY